MKRHLLVFLSFQLLFMGVIAQNKTDREFIIKQTDTLALYKFSQEKTKAANNYKHIQYDNVPKERIILNSRKAYLSGFDDNGDPVYDIDDNIDAAQSINLTPLLIGGESGLDLDGTDIVIGHWEAGGLPLATHVELVDRITIKDNGDETSHASHTACTMIGSGVKSKARGMAPNAHIASYKSNNDESEIASFAAKGGLVSNHSYSTNDPEGNIADYGKYSSEAMEWDNILYSAPYLTICKSAGNTRNDGVNTSDHGYDLVYTIATAKNVITVGAVDDIAAYLSPSSVVQSDFSSWGPTDDWRIKPDFVTNGVGVYSADCTDDDDYTTKNGTSMAAPSAAGAVALLQQHYHNLHGNYMKSATVKALLIASTDEAGLDDGPDFQNGWGLLNIERAASFLTNNGNKSMIQECTLLDGETFTTTIVTDGVSQLKLAIAWTDPSTFPVYGTDIDTPRLINDLDVRVIKNDVSFKPWVFTPNSKNNNFSNAPSTGDNYRDNVERIDVYNLNRDTYTVTVSHKDELAKGEQNFSLVISGLTSDPVATNKELIFEPHVFPNPSNDGIINVSIPDNDATKNSCIEVYTTQGQLQYKTTSVQNQEKIDLSDLRSGLYLIRIQQNDMVSTQKIQINHNR